jgi:hypothetical protein
VSIAKNIANVFGLQRRDVIVKIVEKSSVRLDFVEFSFKDQCISRADLWRFTRRLWDSCVYIDKKISFHSFRVKSSSYHILNRKKKRVDDIFIII